MNISMNKEHALVEAELRKIDDNLADEISNEISKEESIENAFNASHIQEKMMQQATKQAQKILKKNKREIERLKKHAGECLIKNEYFGYSYAIKKLRDFYKQPYNEDLIKSMWDSSRQAMLDIVEHNKK